MKTERFAVYVPLPRERRTIWQDDFVAAETTTKKAAAAAVRLLGVGEVWRFVVPPEEQVHSCSCGDDD